MDDDQRGFLEDLLETASPSGYETPGQRVWVDYVSGFADDVTVDEYGNAVAVHEGDPDVDVAVALAGHGDEIGFVVRRVTDDGYLKLGRVGGSDKTVSRGQHVTVHTDDGPVHGVVGQTAIHLRDNDDEVPDVAEQYVDVGATEGDGARDLVERGDPVTFTQQVQDLEAGRVAARGMDNRVGIWAAAEGLARAVAAEADPTVYAVSTVQEEVGLKGARMVGFDLDPDAVVAADVTHATDSPSVPAGAETGLELGGGPVVSRGSSNHPAVVDAVRDVASAREIDIQLQAAGIRTGTDADAFYTVRGGIPSLNVGIPNRYMHTPVEVVDLDDLDAVATVLGRFGARAAEFAPFTVEV
jgi:putative aminopeptidase FrvX